MKLDLNKIFIDDYFDNYYAYREIDEKYLDKATEIKKRISYDYYRDWNYDSSRFSLPKNHFLTRASKFLGCNVSELVYSYKKENKKYFRSFMYLIRMRMNTVNRNGDIVDIDGCVPQRPNTYYLDDNDIICENPDAKSRHRIIRKEKPKTKLELISNEYWDLRDKMISEKKYQIEFFRIKNKSVLNRKLSGFVKSLVFLEQEYTAEYNFIYDRNTSDKSDRRIKLKRIPQNISKSIAKTKSSQKITKVVKHENPFKFPTCSVFVGASY